MRRSFLVASLLAACGVSCPVTAESTEQGEPVLRATLEWKPLPELPDELGVAGPFVGVHRGVVLVAGGANFPQQPYWENDKVWHDAAWVLTPNGDQPPQWISGQKLDGRIAYGASATTSRGVVCMGGDDGEQVAKRCFLLSYNSQQQTIEQQPLPPLPEPCAYGAAATIGDVVYLACGQTTQELITAGNHLWRLDLSVEAPRWEVLPPCPGPGRAFNMTVAQHDGFETCIYVFGGRRQDPDDSEVTGLIPLTDHWRYQPSENRWRRQRDLPTPRMAGAAIAVGQSHIFCLTGADGSLLEKAAELKFDHPGFPKRMLAYHTITDTWVDGGPTPAAPVTTPAAKWDGAYVLISGEKQPGVRTTQAWSIRPVSVAAPFGRINFSVLTIYLLAMVGVGVYFANKTHDTDDYFRGGKQMAWWAAGCSIFATMLSSITYMAIPAKAYAQDHVYLPANLMIPAVAPIAVYLALPFFRNIDATSAYEYLEKRFNQAVRLFASASFTLFHLFRMGIVMSLAGLALATVTSLSPGQCVLIIGVLSIVYCTLGGVEAVIWTDTIQTVVLLGGALVCFAVMLTGSDGNTADFFRTASADGKLQLANFHLDPTDASLALWVVLLGGIGQNISSYTADQAVVQRYMTTPDARRAAGSIWFAAILSVPASILFYYMGTGLYVFYKSHPEKLDPTFMTDQVLPQFIANELPVGVAGLIVAGIFAAAQSTVSTSMNSTATAVVTDFMRPFGLMSNEQSYLRAARGLTFAFGTIGTAIGLLFVQPDIKSLFDQFLTVIGLFMGVLGGLFALGILTTRASGFSAMAGAVVGATVMGLLPIYTEISGVLYAAIGIAVCFAAGYLLSLPFPAPTRDIEGYTLYTLRSRKQRT